jgi:hypothetical protein
MPQAPVTLAHVAPWHVLRVGTVVGGVLAAVVAGSAWACTPDEYMTAEQRASGQVDMTPPAYETDWAPGTAHTHAPAGTAAGPAPAPAPADGPVEAQKPDVAAAKQPAPAGTRVRQVEPARPAAPRVTTPAPASATSAPIPVATVVAAPVTGTPRAEPRLAARPRPKVTRRVSVSAHPPVREAQRPSAWTPAALASLAATSSDARASGDADPLLLLALLGGIAGLAIAAITLRRRGPQARATHPLGEDEMEAALQELLAEEHAQRSRADRSLARL